MVSSKRKVECEMHQPLTSKSQFLWWHINLISRGSSALVWLLWGFVLFFCFLLFIVPNMLFSFSVEYLGLVSEVSKCFGKQSHGGHTFQNIRIKYACSLSLQKLPSLFSVCQGCPTGKEKQVTTQAVAGRVTVAGPMWGNTGLDQGQPTWKAWEVPKTCLGLSANLTAKCTLGREAGHPPQLPGGWPDPGPMLYKAFQNGKLHVQLYNRSVSSDGARLLFCTLGNKLLV